MGKLTWNRRCVSLELMAARLHWGIMATGGIARKFATDLPYSRTGRLVAVGSRSRPAAEAFARDFGAVRAHASYEAVLADPEVNVVYIAPPHPWHVEWVIRAAEAGKHILCEKPLALRHADAVRAVEAARRHRVFLMEAFAYPCNPQTATLVNLLRDGAVGEVRLIQAAFSVARDFDPEHRMFKRELGGGAILDIGCYPATFARLIARAVAGSADPLAFHGTGWVNPATGTDEYAAAVARFPGGLTAEIACGSTVRHDISARIYGTKGWLDIPVPFSPGLAGRDEVVRLHRAGESAAVEYSFPSRGVPLYAHEADAVGDALARGELEAPAMTHAETLGTAKMLDAWLAQVGVDYAGV